MHGSGRSDSVGPSREDGNDGLKRKEPLLRVALRSFLAAFGISFGVVLGTVFALQFSAWIWSLPQLASFRRTENIFDYLLDLARAL